jgi:hypothetical protein
MIAALHFSAADVARDSLPDHRNRPLKAKAPSAYCIAEVCGPSSEGQQKFRKRAGMGKQSTDSPELD